MRVGITTWGSEGDVRPFIVLAHALVRRGHTVRLDYASVEGRDYSALSLSAGVEARAIGKEYFSSHREDVHRDMARAFATSNPLKQLGSIIRSTLDPVTDEMFDASLDLARESDVMVGHFMTHPAGAAAEKHGKPYVLVSLAPILPSARFPPVGTPDLGRLLNPLLWAFLGRLLDGLLKKRVNETRARVGLAPVDRLLSRLLDIVHSVLMALSPTLFPRPDDWDARIHLSGFLRMPDSVEPWEPDAELRAFLERGDPPAFLSFGSMLSLDHARALESVAVMRAALAKAKMRGIIQAPPEVARGQESDDHSCFIVRAPHAQLFPRCSVIVHHGGAGTTQSTVLAGRPSVVVPHVADQFLWGDQLEKRGIGVKPLPRLTLTPERLAARLREAVGDPAMKERARLAGEALAAEDGATRAAELIEQVS